MAEKVRDSAASRQAENETILRKAKNLGRRWASEKATEGSLEGLRAYVDFWDAQGCRFFGQPDAPFQHSDYVAAAILCRKPNGKASMRFWWKEARIPEELSEELEDLEFLRAFVEGALGE